MILTLLLVQHVAGHVDVDGMDTSVAPADDILAFTRSLPESADHVFGSLTSGTTEPSGAARQVMREKNSLDLWFRWPQRRPLVIENKIFSLPHEKQLEGYATKAAARGEVPVFWLLSLSDPSWTDNRSGQCATTPTWSTCAPTWSPALS